MNIYIQKFGRDFVDDWAYTAYEGFKKRDEHKIFFFEDIEDVPKDAMVVGFIEDTRKFFEIIGFKEPRPLGIPEELKEYIGRKIEIKTLGEFKNDTQLPIFVKPYDKLKTFPSGVIKNASSRKMLFNEYPDEAMVMTSEVLNMESEYRGFVRRGKLIGLKHYHGDFKLFPDVSVIEEAILKYKSAPISYTIDWAVTDDNKTVLIECNDGWSVGCYGLDPELYAGFLMDRWMEITKQNDTRANQSVGERTFR